MSGERVHEDVYDTTIEGARCSFRAALNESGEPRVVWQIGGRRGEGAKFDASDAMVFLPAGVRVRLGGDAVSNIQLPRWLGDALADDFDDLESDSND